MMVGETTCCDGVYSATRKRWPIRRSGSERCSRRHSLTGKLSMPGSFGTHIAGSTPLLQAVNLVNSHNLCPGSVSIKTSYVEVLIHTCGYYSPAWDFGAGPALVRVHFLAFSAMHGWGLGEGDIPVVVWILPDYQDPLRLQVSWSAPCWPATHRLTCTSTFSLSSKSRSVRVR